MERPSSFASSLRRLFRKRWLWISVCGCAAAAAIVLILAWRMTAFHHVRLDRSDEALGIAPRPTATPQVQALQATSGGEPTDKPPAPPPTKLQAGSQVRNIALFGLDRRSKKERGRSDVMIILTLDYDRNKVKLTSLMRDLYVPIEGHGKAKLNAAYAYGGAPLAIKTINQNFGTDIRDYVTVDFFTMEKIINAVGGVDIDVKPDEVGILNQYMAETSTIEKVQPDDVKEGGKQRLNGMQAVAYARIRYVGNADFERTERQRTVLEAMVDRVKSKGVSSIPQLLMKVAPDVETSLSRSDMLSMAYHYFKSDQMAIEQNRYPQDGEWRSATTADGQWILDTDLDHIKQQVQDYIYADQKDSP